MRRKKVCKRLAAGFLLAALAFFWWFGNNAIQTDVFYAPSSALPAAFEGLRVVALADVHGKQFGADNARLLSAVAAAEPDLITINGDLVDDVSELTMVPALARGLRAIAPTFYVTGNHEWAAGCTDELFALLSDCGVTVLRNDYRVLQRGSDRLVVAGVDDPNGPYDQKTPAALVSEIRAAEGDGSYILMLAHRNDQLSQWAALGVQTVLCGHAHGGVVRLPVLGGLIGTHRELFPDYTAGVYTAADTTVLVSRGLGNSVVNFRILNRPELAVLVLTREKENPLL